MRVVVALGGNALLRRGEPLTMEIQRANARVAATAIAPLVRDHTVIVTHGNGPQVGLLALLSDGGRVAGESIPLDVLDAESQGMIGYVLEQELRNALPDCEVATVLTQVKVAKDDPGFTAPTKPIGPVYSSEADARRAARDGSAVAPDGTGWRRVVASPAPVAIVEEKAIEILVDAGVIVVCSGGGGVPVVVEVGETRGVEAVIDKDATAALLAERLHADALLLLTDVDGVYLDWGTERARRLDTVTPSELREQVFAPGTMGPKVAAACRFVARTGGFAGIGALGEVAAVLAHTAGTTIRQQNNDGWPCGPVPDRAR